MTDKIETLTVGPDEMYPIISGANRIFAYTTLGGYIRVGKKACREFCTKMKSNERLILTRDSTNGDLFIK